MTDSRLCGGETSSGEGGLWRGVLVAIVWKLWGGLTDTNKECWGGGSVKSGVGSWRSWVEAFCFSEDGLVGCSGGL